MSRRPDPSDLFASKPFENAAGPFDPALAQERAKQISGMLTGHDLPEGSTPHILGEGLQKRAGLSQQHGYATGLIIAMMNQGGLGRGVNDRQGNATVAAAVESLLKHEGSKASIIIANSIKRSLG